MSLSSKLASNLDDVRFLCSEVSMLLRPRDGSDLDTRFLCSVAEQATSLSAGSTMTVFWEGLLSTSPVVGSQAMGSLSLELNSNSSLDECWMFHADGRRNITAQVRALRDVNCTPPKVAKNERAQRSKFCTRCDGASVRELPQRSLSLGIASFRQESTAFAPSTSSSSSTPAAREKIKKSQIRTCELQF